MSKGRHFVLVHGTCHGAWCWYKLSARLKLAGHRVTALDLGASGVNPSRLDEVLTVSDYVRPLMEIIASLSDHHDHRIVLVGHSFAGLCISLAMEAFPSKIALAVFLTAYMPHHNSPPGLLIQEFFKRTAVESLLDCKITLQDDKPISVIFGPEYMRTNLYPQSQPEDLELGNMLIRPSKLFMDEFSKENIVTEAKFGSVRRVYIECEQDKVMMIEFQRWMMSNNQPEEVMHIGDSDHMVMLSNPNALSQCLLKLAHSKL